MLKQLNEVAQRAYAPYSQFRVAALFEFRDGTVQSGFNIENAAYPSTLCAERVGLFTMINTGMDLTQIARIHIYSPDSADYLSPCGACRQVLSEHISLAVEILMYNNKGYSSAMTLAQLFPAPVSKKTVIGR